MKIVAVVTDQIRWQWLETMLNAGIFTQVTVSDVDDRYRAERWLCRKLDEWNRKEQEPADEAQKEFDLLEGRQHAQEVQAAREAAE